MIRRVAGPVPVVIRIALTVAFTIAAGGCRPGATTAVEPPEPQLEVARERLLPLEDRDHRPLFGPDGSVTVGTTRFAPDGRRVPPTHGAIDGQIHPVAVIGTASRPQVMSLAWNHYPHPSGVEVDDQGSWLISGDPEATNAATFVPTAIDSATETLDERIPAIELSPDRAAIAAIEPSIGDHAVQDARDLVVRSVPDGKVLARTAFGDAIARACWIDAHQLAWRDAPRTLAIWNLTSRRTTRVSADPGELVACAAGGRFAVLAIPSRAAVIDLATGRTRAAIPLADPPDAPGAPHRSADPAPHRSADPPPRDRFALGRDGCDLAVARGRTLAVFRCGAIADTGATWYRPTLVRTLAPDAEPPTWLEFSPDARRLALVGASLVMLELAVARRPPPALPTLVELPPGFVPVTPKPLATDDGWSYAQLSTPTGLSPLPALIVHARREEDPADVITVAIEPDALSLPLPAPGASDAAIERYARAVMPELVEQWRTAEIGTGRDAAFTLKVGHRDGKPWFETRETWRDGCEPYDGYTQVVIDRDLLFVTRALVAPAASTNPWLQTFFDVAFQHRSQLARRRGPDTGPC